MASEVGSDGFQRQASQILSPASNTSPRIPEKALMALPFIGLLVGVNEFVPTKAVYAMYDPSVSSIRFVHGDGTFAIPENICFLESFRGGNPEKGNRQRIHATELMQQSAKYDQVSNLAGPYQLAVYKGRFLTTANVKSALTFYSDLDSGTGELCPALKQLPPLEGYLPVRDEDFYNQGMPCVSLMTDQTWNFDPRLKFKPTALDGKDAFKSKFWEFKEKYNYSSLSWLEFQQAAFCLVGLERAGLVQFVQVWKNSPRSPMLVKPLATIGGWTVDCFLTRFVKFMAFVRRMNFAQCPNPIYWLEAELEDEYRIQRQGPGYQVMRPWKGKVHGSQADAVVDWDALKNLKWKHKDKCYPRPFVPMSLQPLLLMGTELEDLQRIEKGSKKKADNAAIQQSEEGADSDQNDDDFQANRVHNDKIKMQGKSSEHHGASNVSEDLDTGVRGQRKRKREKLSTSRGSNITTKNVTPPAPAANNRTRIEKGESDTDSVEEIDASAFYTAKGRGKHRQDYTDEDEDLYDISDRLRDQRKKRRLAKAAAISSPQMEFENVSLADANQPKVASKPTHPRAALVLRQMPAKDKVSSDALDSRPSKSKKARGR